MKEKTALEVMDEAVKSPTLDELLDRLPSTMKWPEDYEQLVRTSRADRALFNIKQEKKSAKKQGVEVDED